MVTFIPQTDRTTEVHSLYGIRPEAEMMLLTFCFLLYPDKYCDLGSQHNIRIKVKTATYNKQSYPGLVLTEVKTNPFAPIRLNRVH